MTEPTNTIPAGRIDTATIAGYNEDDVRRIAQEAAQKAVAGFMSMMVSGGLAQLDNCMEQDAACPDENGGQAMASRIKAKISVNGKDLWITGHTIQELVSNALEANQNANKPVSVTFQEYADKYIKRYKSNGSVERNTQIGYLGYLKNHLYPFLGNMPIESITVDVIQDYINQKAETHSQKSIREHINLMRQIFDAAVEDNLIDRNPCTSSRLQIVGSKSTKVMAYTEEEFGELERLIGFLDGTEKLFVAMSLYTGMRQGELFALQWEDIDLQNNLIHVSKAVEWPGQNRGMIKEPKTENGIRIIVIIPKLAAFLKSMQHDTGYVLTADRQKDNEPMSHQAVKRLNERIGIVAKENGINVHFLSHRARHTVATFMNNAGADDVSITGIIGHSDVAFTKRQYANTQTTQLQRGMAKFADYISNFSGL